MPEYIVTSASEPRFSVRIGECTPEHADSVLRQLLIEPTVPSDLTLTDLTPAPEPQVEPEPVKRSWSDRLLGRNLG